MALVRLENITKVYPGGVVAVDDVTLFIADQEFVVLVGPSGCGKTTTLRLIAGLESGETGTIRIGDRVVNHVLPKDRDIAMVFQNYALYPHMTVFGNMSFALRLRMLPGFFSRLVHRAQARAVRADIRQRVERVADLLEIRELLNRKPRELSGGQRQRVALGRAIVREPAAFLFDEPLSNLDARLRVTTRAELKRLHQRLKTTTIYVTHDQEEAMTLGDRIVVMRDGKIQQADPAMTTYHRPVNRFVAGFIGMPPMNFFDGFLRQSGDGLAFEEQPSDVLTQGQESAGKSASDLTLTKKGFTLSLSGLAPTVRARLSVWIDRRVVLGIRPEHLSLRPLTDLREGAAAATASQPLEMRIVAVEPLGSHLDLSMKTPLQEQLDRSDQVVARVEAPAGESLGALTAQSRVMVHVDLRRVHLFEPGETGMNLSLETMSLGPTTAELAHAMA